MYKLFEAFPAEVLSHKINGCSLGQEIETLKKVHSCGATEGVAFYCARIHEAVFKEAHHSFFRSNVRNLAETENNLFKYNLLPLSRYYWSRGLRLLGNEVRHDMSHLTDDEAELAIFFIIFLLKWYFCEFQFGNRHPSISIGGMPTQSPLLQLLSDIESKDFEEEALVSVFNLYRAQRFTKCPRNMTFPLLLLEIAINNDNLGLASLILTEISSLARHGIAQKNRFLQLHAVHLSRSGHLEQAMSVINEAIQARKEGDEESMGIRAGIYKRLWKRDKKQDLLEKSQDEYYRGWKSSNNLNTYLGVNAATTSLWLNKKMLAEKVAIDVKAIVEKRQKDLKSNGRDLNYWDMVTLAEANMLMGDCEEGKLLYRTAFSTFSAQKSNIDGSKDQLSQLIPFLDLNRAMEDDLKTSLQLNR